MKWKGYRGVSDRMPASDGREDGCWFRVEKLPKPERNRSEEGREWGWGPQDNR